MKKMLLTAVSAAVLALPGVALASHDDGAAHQNREHQGVEHQGVGHHRGQHRHGDARRAHDASSRNRREVRGTVASFVNGVLTITRASGSAVSGKVSDRTVLECPAVTASAASHGDNSGNDSSGDRGDGVANQGPGNAGQDDPAGHDAGDDNGVDPAGHDVGDDNGVDDPAGHEVGDDNGVDPAGHDARDDNGQDKAEHCTTAALVAGAIVREAKLRTSGADATWLKIELGS